MSGADGLNVRIPLLKAKATPSVIARLGFHFPSLRVAAASDGSEIRFDSSSLSDADRTFLELDISFLDKNPTLPLENLCSRLDTYEPKTDSQQEMLEYAQRLAALSDDSRGAGLYMWGEAGIGKSHISVGISKVFMSQGLDPIFMVADTYTFDSRLRLEAGQVWIIDDLNSGYGLASRLFKQVVMNIHDKGGRMFVTSNKHYDKLMREMFVGEGDADRMRYEDRTKGMFKILHVTGESYRQENAWYQA